MVIQYNRIITFSKMRVIDYGRGYGKHLRKVIAENKRLIHEMGELKKENHQLKQLLQDNQIGPLAYRASEGIINYSKDGGMLV